MSKHPQLGLFSSPDKVGSPASDLAIHVAALPAAATVVPTSETMPSAKSRPAANISGRRNNEVVQPAKPLAEERYLSVQDVARRYAISIQTVWRHTKHNPDFPKPIKILNGSTRWRMSDILAFEVSRQEISR